MHVMPKEAAGLATAERERPLQRVVLKIGSRILTDSGGRLRPEGFPAIARVVIDAPDIEMVIVTSGAVTAGFATLGHESAPFRVEERLAAAAVGQTKVMRQWTEVFEELGRDIAQVLLTNDSLTDRRRYVTARRSMRQNEPMSR